MTGENGRTGETAKRMVTVIPLDCGINIWVKPIAQDTLATIDARAAAKFPPPDPAPYEKPIEDSAIPGQKWAADADPEYQRLMEDVHAQRAEWKLRILRDLTVEFPDYPNRGDLIDHFQDEVDQLIALDLIEPPEDEDALWDIIWKHCLIKSTDNQVELLMVARSQMPITQEETAEAVRLFRTNLSRQALRGLVIRSRRETNPSGAAGE